MSSQLILSRRIGERIVIDGNIEVMVLAVRGNQVRLGITAPRDIPVNRWEIQQAIDSQKPVKEVRA